MKKFILYFVLSLSLLVVASGCTQKTAANSPQPPVNNKKPAVEAFGVVKAQEVKHVIVDMPAAIKDILVVEGELVKAKQPLVVLDLTEFKAQLAIKERELRIARLELDRAPTDTLKKMQRERIAALEQELGLMKEKLGKSYFAKDTVIADFPAGIVYDIGYQVGDLLKPGQKLFAVMQVGTLIVEANIYEEFIKDVALGAKVEIVPLADKTKTYVGEVISISATAIKKNNETVVPIQISIPNHDAFLRPNFNVDVVIEIR